MNFRELAWGVYLYQAVEKYDKVYKDLFSQQQTLGRLRENPGSVSVKEFENSVVDFLRKWGGQHINKLPATPQALLSGVIAIQAVVQKLRASSFPETNVDDIETNIQLVISRLEAISWKNKPGSNVSLGATFASKLAHVLHPGLFVMWDENIAKHYTGERPKSINYTKFFRTAQHEARKAIASYKQYAPDRDLVEFLNSVQRVPDAVPVLTKYIDAYDWVRFSHLGASSVPSISPPLSLIKASTNP
jgi:hypothetical protein